MITYALTRPDWLTIKFPYDALDVLEVKKLPGRRFDSDNKCWGVPVSSVLALPLAEFADATKSEIPAEVLRAIQSAVDARKNNLLLSSAKETKFDRLPLDLAVRLRPFQLAGVEYAVNNKRVLIGDEMGLGKTVQAIATVETLGAYPCLVICPASLKYNWRAEWEKWLPGRTLLVVNGHDPAEWELARQVVVINYDVLSKHEFLLSIPWRSVIVDESHYIKNRKAQRTRSVQAICKQAETVLLLSGTPVLNKPYDLVTQLEALGKLEHFGGFWGFVREYCNATKGKYGWDFSGAEDLDVLNEKLRETCYIRREKCDVLTELPDKIRTDLVVEITTRKEYDEARAELIEFIREQGKVKADFLAGLDPALSEAERVEAIADYRENKARKAARARILVEIATLKQITADGKIEAAREWIDDLVELEIPLVVFAWHREVVQGLAKIYNCDALDGSTSAEDRQAMVERFQAGETKIIAMNMQAGGVGLTLTAASHELFIEFGWNPGTMDQAEDRLHRIGQKSAVNVYRMIGRDTIDEASIALIEHKREIVKAVTSGAPVDVGTDDDLDFILEQFGEVYNE